MLLRGHSPDSAGRGYRALRSQVGCWLLVGLVLILSVESFLPRSARPFFAFRSSALVPSSNEESEAAGSSQIASILRNNCNCDNMMSHLSSRAGELKSQGAVEAAQNPDSRTNAEDAERVILNESQKAGAMAFRFDATASPEAKAAQAHTVRFPVLSLGRL